MTSTHGSNVLFQASVLMSLLKKCKFLVVLHKSFTDWSRSLVDKHVEPENFSHALVLQASISNFFTIRIIFLTAVFVMK